MKTILESCPARRVLRPGTVPLQDVDEEAVRATCFGGEIPVATYSLYDMWYKHDFDKKVITAFCEAGVIPHARVPDDANWALAELERQDVYLVDFESAVRAYVIHQRHKLQGAATARDLIADPTTGGDKLRDLLCEFMRADCFSYAHHGDYWGTHTAPAGYAYRPTFPRFHAIRGLRAYAGGNKQWEP